MDKLFIISIIIIILIIILFIIWRLYNYTQVTLEQFQNKEINKEQKLNNYNIDNEPIDFVYTWVDQHDPERDAYMKKEGFTDPKDDGTGIKRFKNTKELKYSLRSVAKYCPWVNMIYIVVKDGQSPSYINFAHPKIKLINHSEIMPSEVIPTFNSSVIELFIHKIPNLSNRYIYMNDDFFINKSIKKSDFYDTRGYPYVTMKNYGKGIIPKSTKSNAFYNFNNLLQNTTFNTQRILGIKYYFYMSHVPSVCYKPWDQEIENLLKRDGIWQTTVTSRTRKSTDIVINNLFRNAFYKEKGSEIAKWDDNFIELNNANTCKINIIPDSKFYSINSVIPKCEETFFKFMNEKYPQKTDWESNYNPKES